MHKKILPFVLFLLVMMLSVHAMGDFTTILTPIIDKISVFETAAYSLTIENNMGYDSEFQTYSPSIEWMVQISPRTDEIVRIKNGEQRKIKIEFQPSDYINPGQQYGIQINVRALGADRLKKQYALVGVKSQYQVAREYQPALAVIIDSPKIVDPREKYQIKLDIENKNILDIQDLVITIDSTTQHLESETTLGPLKQKTVLFTLDFDDATNPKKDYFAIRTYAKNRSVTEDLLPYEIIGYDDTIERTDEEKQFMKRITTTYIKNNGNREISNTYKYHIGFFAKPFAGTSQDVAYTKGDYVFSYILIPGGSIQLSVERNYRFFLYLAIIIILSIVSYYLLRSPIVVYKSVSSVSTTEGAISELKLMLHVRNRTNKPIEEVLIIDRSPRLIDVVNEFSLGTLKPYKILHHDKKGTIAKWFFEGLEAYEERVITYRIRSKLNILGGLTLPLCLVKFKGRKGKEYMVHSNRVKIILKKEKNLY